MYVSWVHAHMNILPNSTVIAIHMVRVSSWKVAEKIVNKILLTINLGIYFLF